MAPLPEKPTPERVRKLQVDWAYILGKMSRDCLSEQDKLLCLMSKISRVQWSQLRTAKEDRARTTNVNELFKLLAEKARDQVAEDHMNRHRKIMEQATRTKTVNMIEEEEFEEVYAVQGKDKEKGRGRGRGGGKGGRGRGNGEDAEKDPRFSATVICKYCHRSGHYVDTCYRKQREEKKVENALKKGNPGAVKTNVTATPPGSPVPPVRPVAPLPPPYADDEGRRKRQRLELIEQLHAIERELREWKLNGN